MNNAMYSLLFVLTSTALHTAPMVYLHDDKVKADNSCFVALEQARFNINNTYLPQQVINVQHKAKQLPAHMLSFLRKACYLKVLLADSCTELIMQKERVDVALARQINAQESHAYVKGSLIRLYRKIEGTNSWQPIASIPEAHAQIVFDRAIINPNGTINL